MNILNKQIDSIYDRQKNLYSKYPHYSQQNPEGRVLMLDKIIWKNDWPEVKGQSPSLELERPEV